MPFVTLSRALLMSLACAVGAFAWYATRVEGPALSRLIAERERLLEQRRQEVRELEHRVHVIEAEIQALEVDSEESSLMARTLLGMVLPSELLYQLSGGAGAAAGAAGAGAAAGAAAAAAAGAGMGAAP